MGKDFFREFPGRYLGYCHPVGRVMPSDIVPTAAKKWLHRTTMGYIVFDILHKATDKRRSNAVLKGVDALVWQSLASVLLPGLVVDGVARGSFALMHHLKVSTPMNRYVPIGLVLLAMPLFGQTIDGIVDSVLDNTLRPIIL